MWIVPVESGLEYMRSLFFGANLSNEQLIAQGKDSGPFACADIENQTGKYEKTRNRCGPAKSCRLGKGSKTPGTETFRWGGTPPGASTDEIFPKS